MKLNLLVIRVADLNRAVQFYEAIGLSFVEEQHGQGPVHRASTIDSVVFELYPRTHEPTTHLRLGFLVDSIAEVLTNIEAVGGRIHSPLRNSQWGLRAVVIDPDGHHIELTQASAADLRPLSG